MGQTVRGGRDKLDGAVLDDAADEEDLVLRVMLTEVDEKGPHLVVATLRLVRGCAHVVEDDAELLRHVASVRLAEQREVELGRLAWAARIGGESSHVEEYVVELGSRPDR